MRLAAIDLGGTAVKGAHLCDGKIIRRHRAPTVCVDRQTVLDSVCTVIDACKPFDGIAVSSAGDIDPYRGVCTYATDNLPGFTGLDIRAYLSARYGVPVSVINDGHAALLGEATARTHNEPTVMLTLGTGVGGAYYDGKAVVFGDDFTFGRFGHLPLVENGLKCTCGKRGCIEAYISGSAVVRAASAIDLTPAELFVSDRPQAVAAVETFCRDLAAALETIHAQAPFALCIIGGGVARSAAQWLPVLKKYTTRRVEAATLGDDAGLLGAAAWFREAVCGTM